MENSVVLTDFQHFDREYVSGMLQLGAPYDQRGSVQFRPPLSDGSNTGNRVEVRFHEDAEKVEIGEFRVVCTRSRRAIQDDALQVRPFARLHAFYKFSDTLFGNH